ncbi:MAG TPA: tetratricopeptide repeat protein, partial [Candidatus Saccharimonadales bacterium]|nr:tetratricopeptide repeat protein [Candidatus Saccharimonadales bacterium]
MRQLFILLAAFLASNLTGWSHGDMHGQIVETTKLIDKDPRNPSLYIKRSDLYRAHGDFDNAYADLEQASILDRRMEVLPLARGRLFFEANWPQSAKNALDQFLASHTNHVEAHALRARCLSKLGRRMDAVKDYSRAIAFSAEGAPELYLERAQTLSEEGTKYFPEAVKGLEEGMKKMGPLITLQLYAIDLEARQKNFDAALTRLDTVAAASPRKETWLARKGELLQQAGRPDEAAEAFKAALKAIAKLPDARRYVPAMQELEKRIQAVLQALAKEKESQK